MVDRTEEPQRALVERDNRNNPFAREDDRTRLTALADAEATKAIAQVQAQLVIARKFPRDKRLAMDRLLMECTLPILAEHASYEYTRGGTDIRAPSIRLAEAICRNWGNISTGVIELARHEGFSECQAYAWDLETGWLDEKKFQVRHIRDRSERRGGPVELTDERDIYELVANMGARRKRACILAVIPPDVIENAMNECDRTLTSKVVITDETIKSMLDAFEGFGVTKEHVEDFIQRRLTKETLTPGMRLRLGRIYNSLKDGMSKPEDWFKIVPAADGDKTASGRKKPAGKAKKDDKKTDDKDSPAIAADLLAIRTKAKACEITEPEICKAFKVETLEMLSGKRVPAVLRWLSDPTSAPE